MRVVAICAQRTHDNPVVNTLLIIVVALKTDLIRWVEKLIDVVRRMGRVAFPTIFISRKVDCGSRQETAVTLFAS